MCIQLRNTVSGFFILVLGSNNNGAHIDLNLLLCCLQLYDWYILLIYLFLAANWTVQWPYIRLNGRSGNESWNLILININYARIVFVCLSHWIRIIVFMVLWYFYQLLYNRRQVLIACYGLLVTKLYLTNILKF